MHNDNTKLLYHKNDRMPIVLLHWPQSSRLFPTVTRSVILGYCYARARLMEGYSARGETADGRRRARQLIVAGESDGSNLAHTTGTYK